MWTRDLLKLNAKHVLQTNYWTALLVCLVTSILTGSNTGLTVHYSVQLDDFYYSDPFRFLSGPVLMSILGIGFLASLIGIAIAVFIRNPVTVGKSRYFMESRVGNAPFSSVFSTFGGPAYRNVVKVMFMKDLFIALWSLLLIIPGIYKAYQYRMVDYLLAENPYMPYQRALELSRQMTEGEKFNIFILEVSFFGWIFLGGLLCGIGSIFVLPYIEATFAELYAALRAKAFASGMTDSTELGDFVRY